jgi:hypothetical protein
MLLASMKTKDAYIIFALAAVPLCEILGGSIFATEPATAGAASPSAQQSPATSQSAAPELPTVLNIIGKEGQFIFSDGSSYYLFKRGGTFQSFPIGMSGRTIDGNWKSSGPRSDGSSFEIVGDWSWANGSWPDYDRRKMTLVIYPYGNFKTVERMPWLADEHSWKVYNCYFEVEELVKIPKDLRAKPADK